MGDSRYKFRIWAGEGMHYGGFSIHATGKIMPLEGLSPATEESPVMQWTGLKDRNGVEIYEGDIVNYHFVEDWSKMVCQWNGDKAEFALYDPSDKHYWGVNAGDISERAEVIGNIHENPELIEGA